MKNNISSIELAKSLNMEHRSIYIIIEKHIDSFNEFGEVKKDIYRQGKQGGRPCDYFMLNVVQKLFLIMLLKNSHEGIKAKVSTLKLILSNEVNYD